MKNSALGFRPACLGGCVGLVAVPRLGSLGFPGSLVAVLSALALGSANYSILKSTVTDRPMKRMRRRTQWWRGVQEAVAAHHQQNGKDEDEEDGEEEDEEEEDV